VHCFDPRHGGQHKQEARRQDLREDRQAIKLPQAGNFDNSGRINQSLSAQEADIVIDHSSFDFAKLLSANMASGTSIGMMDPAYFVGRRQILEWLNSTFSMSLTKIEQTASGMSVGVRAVTAHSHKHLALQERSRARLWT